MGNKVVTGNRYLGGYIGDKEAEGRWLTENIKEWTDSVEILAGVYHKHPQSDYAVLQKSLQQELVFVQRVTPVKGDAFGLMETALRETYVPALFEGLGNGVLERGVTRLPVKQAGFSLPEPS